MTISIVLLVVALVLFVLAALNVGSPRFSLGWAGSAFAVAAVLVRGL